MANKKINQLDFRTGVALTDLLLIGDPTTGTSFKLTGTDFKTLLNNVPYTGATGNVHLGEFGISSGYFQADLTPTLTGGIGRLIWNDTDGTLDLGLKGGNVTLQIGQEQVQRVVNKSSVNLLESAYQVVKVTDAQGQRLAVDLAQANNDANSTDTLGIVTETISVNQEGFITTSGIIRGINTTGSLQGETWVDGDVLYLSPTTPGAITKVKPNAPNHSVILGYVVYAHGVNGKIFVKCDNGYEIGELHNVFAPTPSNNDGLFWNTANSRYQNNSIAGALGYTPISGSGVTGQVAYWNGTNSQTGSNNLFWDAANARLGIGTNAPSATLTVSGGLTLLSGSLSLPVAIHSIFGGAYRIWNRASNRWTFEANNANIGFEFKHIMTSGNAFHIVNTSDTSQFLVSGGGNTILGSTSDGGQRLQVYGDALISNSAASGTFFEVKRTSTTDRFFRVLSTGNIEASSISTGDPNFQFLTGANNTSTTGDRRFFWLQNNFSPTSGIATYRTLELTTVINQTGGANGITRGLYVNPTLTAAADWRSIEWSNNSGWGLYGAGTAPNYLGGTLTAASLIKSGGTSSQYLMADGSVTTGSALTITNRQTASYTLALTDADKLVEMNVATANNLTVPLNSSIAFAIGTKIDLAQYGAGQTTVVATSGVTVRSAGGALKLALQYSGASLVKIATNEWYLFGDITV